MAGPAIGSCGHSLPATRFRRGNIWHLCRCATIKRLLAPLALAVAVILTECGGAEPAPAGAAESTATHEASRVPDLAETWKQGNSASKDANQEAKITGDTISIDWVSDGGDTTSIYWVGTFKDPTDATEPYIWTSKRDVAKTGSALLASTDDSKEFTFEGDTISYKVSALGSTTTVKLKKN